MCDLVEVVLLEQLERRVLADRQGLVASGVREDLPWFPQAVADLREQWASEPGAAERSAKGLSPEEVELRRALKVA